ncbi:MAG: tRNA pseudouridine(55) synthase TruB [Acidimicrobiaceae bacterium]|nr:tRNA pseudouridine(55) synthase TruB [Acidimicrobiaceae bacterium]
MPDGVAVIDKPAGWTSHDVVAKARSVLATRKVGHSGTLDPDATGVLVLGVGRATRLLRYVTGLPKSYEAEIVLGIETDTLDSAGQVTARHDMAGVSAERIRAAVAALTGEILQVPPMVSAVKVGGRRLHTLARAGVEVEREARPVTVHRFEVAPVPGTDAVLSAVVDCSSGTYVRVIAADLGRALGGGAHLRSLRRTAVGGFGLDAARPVESAEVLPMAHAVQHLAGVRVPPAVAAEVAHGRVLELVRLGVAAPPEPGAPSGPWAVHDSDGELLAVYERFRGGAKPAVVVAGPPTPLPEGRR